VTLYHVWKYLNSLPAFAAIISQLVTMSALEHCIWQKRSAADKAFLVYLKSCSCNFLLEWHTVIAQYYQALLSDWLNQRFAAIDQVCRRKVSFVKLTVPHLAIYPLDSSKKEEISWELLRHSPYSPDLAPSNFHLFGPQSESLGDRE